MRLSEVYSSSGGFLKADDLGDSKPVVTIESFEVTERDYNDGNGLKKQIVLSFVGREKKLGLNFTNASRLAELTKSDDVSDWVGKTIKLFVEKVKVGSEMKPSIRIFPELPEQVPFTAESAQFTGANRPPDVNATPPDDDDAPVGW